MTAPRYELVLTPPAHRAITDALPEPVAVTVIDFLTTALPDNLAGVGMAHKNRLLETSR